MWSGLTIATVRKTTVKDRELIVVDNGYVVQCQHCDSYKQVLLPDALLGHSWTRACRDTGVIAENPARARPFYNGQGLCVITSPAKLRTCKYYVPAKATEGKA
jgi:hypothetical protein